MCSDQPKVIIVLTDVEVQTMMHKKILDEIQSTINLQLSRIANKSIP
jgi:hypothetical protein